MSDELAIRGGSPVRKEPFVLGSEPSTRDIIGQEEIDAVTEVLKSQRLSGFVAGSDERFFGGDVLTDLESKWAEYFDVEHCIGVNSWTSGLYACVGAADLEPGSEVIVPAITMSACPSAILGNNCVPVFADVKADTCNIDPESIRQCITEKTGAIMVVHLYGYPAEMDVILDIADEHDLTVIEDAAQAPDTKYDGQYVGTIGDIGGFSLNVHKHIHTGEGGMIVTDNDELARRTQLIRNHGEAVVGKLEGSVLGELNFDYTDLLGQNYRMAETTAAIAGEQLNKLPALMKKIRKRGAKLRARLEPLDIVDLPPIRVNSTHAYYQFAVWYNKDVGQVPLDSFIEAIQAEGIPFSRYLGPLYNLPIYDEGNVHTNGLASRYDVGGASRVSYEPCPVAERISADEMIRTEAVMPETSADDINDIATAFEKIESNLDSLPAV